MIYKETIAHWANDIVPAVFRAEDELLRTKPEWKERLKNVSKEDAQKVVEEYCYEIAKLIVTRVQEVLCGEDEE